MIPPLPMYDRTQLAAVFLRLTVLFQLRATESTILELDYKDEDTIKKAAAALHQKGITLDVLVHCGGTTGSIPYRHAGVTADEVQPRHHGWAQGMGCS